MKIGIFGGTFNPIHIGHAIIANYIAQNSDLDAVWFMVAPQNPLKQHIVNEASDSDRVKMVELVTNKLDNVYTSEFEFSLPRPSYTYNTLCELSRQHPNDEFYLIVGGDNWGNFSKWKNFEDIIRNYQILVYPRFGYDTDIPGEYSGNVSIVDAPIIELSSTQIRTSLRQNQNIRFYLPDEVYDYILKNKLYK